MSTIDRAPADWYPDPDDATKLRYWDGTAWTEHFAPTAQPAVAQGLVPVGQSPVPVAPQVVVAPAVVPAYYVGGAVQPKSMATAMVLTAFFGALGMLYSDVKGALVFMGIGFGLFIITALTAGFGVLLFPLAWIGQMLWTYHAVTEWNRRLGLA